MWKTFSLQKFVLNIQFVVSIFQQAGRGNKLYTKKPLAKVQTPFQTTFLAVGTFGAHCTAARTRKVDHRNILILKS